MEKVIKYKYLSCEVKNGTDEKTDMVQIIIDKAILCPTQAVFDANYPIAEMEAIPGSIEVLGAFDPEPVDAEDVLNALLGVTE